MVEERTLPTLIDADASLGETLKVLAAREAHRTSLWDPVSRRRALYRLGAAALVAAPMKAIACSIIPSETAGPYPGDGTNGPNVLTQSGIRYAQVDEEWAWLVLVGRECARGDVLCNSPGGLLE